MRSRKEIQNKLFSTEMKKSKFVWFVRVIEKVLKSIKSRVGVQCLIAYSIDVTICPYFSIT